MQYAGTQAGLIVSDIAACESVVHIVDNLLLPEPTSSVPSFQPSPQDVLQALSQTGRCLCCLTVGQEFGVLSCQALKDHQIPGSDGHCCSDSGLGM